MPIDKFSQFCQAANKAKKVTPFTGTLLALDPGETTGWCVFDSEDGKHFHLVAQGQEKTWEMDYAVSGLTGLIKQFKPDHIVHELYAIYEWKSSDHSWSQVPTLRIIGCLETLCIQQNIPYSAQTAQIAKNFCTDDKLRMWNYYIKGARHARDAIRHGTYYLMFHA